MRAELEYLNDLPYEVIAGTVGSDWSYREFENRQVAVADKLAAAMRSNPHLKVHVASGHYDGAKPYFATEHTLARLQIPDELRRNIDTSYYEAAHMMDIHEPSRVQQSADLAAFIRAASNR